jgi:hypothetical protein
VAPEYRVEYLSTWPTAKKKELQQAVKVNQTHVQQHVRHVHVEPENANVAEKNQIKPKKFDSKNEHNNSQKTQEPNLNQNSNPNQKHKRSFDKESTQRPVIVDDNQSFSQSVIASLEDDIMGNGGESSNDSSTNANEKTSDNNSNNRRGRVRMHHLNRRRLIRRGINNRTDDQQNNRRHDNDGQNQSPPIVHENSESLNVNNEGDKKTASPNPNSRHRHNPNKNNEKVNDKQGEKGDVSNQPKRNQSSDFNRKSKPNHDVKNNDHGENHRDNVTVLDPKKERPKKKTSDDEVMVINAVQAPAKKMNILNDISSEGTTVLPKTSSQRAKEKPKDIVFMDDDSTGDQKKKPNRKTWWQRLIQTEEKKKFPQK